MGEINRFFADAQNDKEDAQNDNKDTRNDSGTLARSDKPCRFFLFSYS